MGPSRVVVLEPGREHTLEMGAVEDQDPVQALAPSRSNLPLDVRIGLGRCDRRSSHLNAFRPEDKIGATALLGIVIVDQHPGLQHIYVPGSNTYMEDAREIAIANEHLSTASAGHPLMNGLPPQSSLSRLLPDARLEKDASSRLEHLGTRGVRFRRALCSSYPANASCDAGPATAVAATVRPGPIANANEYSLAVWRT
jgi:hypothetical protein